ncbi:MAG: hypothetical protein CM15mP18_0020 [Methanobacteriota archaeon]|nr:MAG: hypothetical protein CM15mP18_0020 [Euryarchaeota archaeon]
MGSSSGRSSVMGGGLHAPSFNPSSSGRRKAVMQEGGEVPGPMAPCCRGQVLTPNDAHEVLLRGAPKRVRKLPGART